MTSTAIEEQYITIGYDQELKCLYSIWSGVFPDFEKLKITLNKALELVEETQASFWLADARKMPLLSKDMENWINQDWTPRAVAKGLKGTIMVIPASALSRLALNSMVKNNDTDKGMMPMFDNIEDARNWIRAHN